MAYECDLLHEAAGISVIGLVVAYRKLPGTIYLEIDLYFLFESFYKKKTSQEWHMVLQQNVTKLQKSFPKSLQLPDMPLFGPF